MWSSTDVSVRPRVETALLARLATKARRTPRGLLGLEPWSFSRAVKASVKRATVYIGNFERVLAERARSVGAQGVICGHIHQPVIRDLEGLTYMNCGDWIEHCTAIVERWEGGFELVTWTDTEAAAEEEEAALPPPLHSLYPIVAPS